MILTYFTTEARRRRAACALALALAAAAGCGGALDKSPDGSGGAGGGGQIGGAGGVCGHPICGDDVAETLYCTNEQIYVEDCDGTDLKHSTCQSRGYIDGTLACKACFFDESNCTTCAPLDAQLLSCTPKVQAGQGIALAATDTEVAIAWQQNDALWFQRLAPDLSTRGAAVRIADAAIGALDLISTPTGWLLADFTDSVRVFALDRQGAPASTVVLAQDQWPPDTDGDVWVRLVAGANGPIVIWLNATSAAYTLYDAALSADGTTVRAQQQIGPLGGRSFAAAPLGDGLLVAAPFSSTLDLGFSTVATLVTGADGKPLGSPTAIDRDLDLPALAPTTDGGAVMLFPDGVTPMWKKLDATGAIQAGPVALDTTENIFGQPISLVPLGGDRLMILTPNIVLGSSIRTTLLWMDGAGNLSGSAKTIEANPQTDAIRGARSGSNVVVAWNLNDVGTLLPGHESFGLALVATP